MNRHLAKGFKSTKPFSRAIPKGSFPDFRGTFSAQNGGSPSLVLQVYSTAMFAIGAEFAWAHWGWSCTTSMGLSPWRIFLCHIEGGGGFFWCPCSILNGTGHHQLLFLLFNPISLVPERLSWSCDLALSTTKALQVFISFFGSDFHCVKRAVISEAGILWDSGMLWATPGVTLGSTVHRH